MVKTHRNCTTSADGTGLWTADVLRTDNCGQPCGVRTVHYANPRLRPVRSPQYVPVYQCALSQQSAVPLVRAGNPQHIAGEFVIASQWEGLS
jgi:hypothetical protein